MLGCAFPKRLRPKTRRGCVAGVSLAGRKKKKKARVPCSVVTRRRRYVVFDFLRRRLSTAQKPRNAFFFCKVLPCKPGQEGCAAVALRALRETIKRVRDTPKKKSLYCYVSRTGKAFFCKGKHVLLLQWQQQATAAQPRRRSRIKLV